MKPSIPPWFILEPVTRRLALLALVLLALAGGTVASAARVTFAAGGMAAGSATVGRCDTAVAATLAVTGGNATSVTITDIASACAGGSLRATLTQGGAPLATLATTTVPAGGGSMTLSVPAPQPTAGAVTDVRVVVVGP
jgi:hypothetical protein